MSAKEDAKRLLEPGSTVFLVTIGEDGQPDARTMSTTRCDGLKTVWLLTGKGSDKYRELSRNPRCMLYATDPDDTEDYLELRLWGGMELLDDAESRAQTWRDDYQSYFPDGKDDPNLGVLKFTAVSGALQTQAKKEKFTL